MIDKKIYILVPHHDMQLFNKLETTFLVGKTKLKKNINKKKY